jgi:hypothetical protein
MPGGNQRYLVRGYGRPRADGVWIGWLTFVNIDGHTLTRTPGRTTQSSLDQVGNWPVGLQLSDLETAFEHAA